MGFQGKDEGLFIGILGRWMVKSFIFLEHERGFGVILSGLRVGNFFNKI